jgi:probable selenium-dependent hydroxylase accessory protein YqeC
MTPAQQFQDLLSLWFLPGAIYTFVGAGGKTTALKRVAQFLSGNGVEVRLTTTTRVGIAEFEGFSVSVVHSSQALERTFEERAPSRLLVGGTLHDQGKFLGLSQSTIENVLVPVHTVLLVEADGSRKRPMKVPEGWEPVIPANSSTVFALMGASAFEEPIDEAHCYNHQKALALLGKTGSFFEPREIAALAADPAGSSKGVLSGMGFRLLINQGDLDHKRGIASEALRLAQDKYGIRGAVVSLQRGELYDSTEF